MTQGPQLTSIVYVDADACTVKNEIYKVAERYRLKVILAANQFIKVPFGQNIEMKVVSGDFDAADDWIVEQIREDDLLVTSDLLLAERAIQKKARVLGSKGGELDEESIGAALAGRELNAHLRNLGHHGTGPSSMNPADRSRFLSAMDRVLQSLLKKHR